MNAIPWPFYPRRKIRYTLYRSLVPVWKGTENPTARRGSNAHPFILWTSCYTDYEIPAAWCSLLVSLQTINAHQKASRLLMRTKQVRGLKPCQLYYYYYYYYYYDDDDDDSNEHHAYASHVLISKHSYGKTRRFGNGKINKVWKTCPCS